MTYTPFLGAYTGTVAAAQTVPEAPTSFKYDLGGNLTEITDPLGRVTTQAYDPLDRVKQIQQPLTNGARPTIKLDYDGLDQLATVADPRKLVTTYTNTGLGDGVGLASPDTGGTTRTFDLAGRVATVKDARGKVTTYKYDVLGRLKSESYTTGTATVFEYDGGAAGVGAPNAIGHLTKMTDESGSTVYSYTGFGDVASKTQTVTAGGKSLAHTVSYGYGSSGSATGKLTSVTYPSGNQVNYRYDEAGRLNMITVHPVNANGTGTNTSQEYTLLKNVAYSAHGPVTGWLWGNSSSGSPTGYSRSFDLDGRIVSYNLGNPAATGSTRTVGWDAASRIKAYTHVSSGVGINASALDQRFDYDDLDRLTSFTGNGTTQTYTYDATGNRTTATFGGGSYTNTISATSNRLDATTGPTPAKTNQYDLAGNLTSDGTVTYTYSARGRMSSAKVGTATTSYLYNGLGQRVRQVVGTNTNPTGLLVYDEAGHIIGEYNSTTGNASKEFIYLGDMPVGVLEQVVKGITPNLSYATNLYYVYVDHLATPRVVTRSPDGKMAWRWDSGDPFGLLPPNENPAGLGVFTFNLRMPGQYFDRSTNLFYNYFRDYDPQTGRYVQSDPIGLDGGLNTYAYVNGSPLTYIDPLGLVQMCHRNLQLPIPGARHCYLKYEDGSTSSYDPKGVNLDPDPNQKGTVCTPQQDSASDSCVKKAMQQCQGTDYSFTKFNCCHCAEQALKECGVSLPPSSWPNWPVNPGPQPGDRGYNSKPIYTPNLGK